MSEYHERQYRLARERELAADRVRQTTQEYVDRYESILSDVEEQGLVEFVHNEYMHLRAQLDNIQQLLYSDPFRAREISFSLGQAIHALPRNARSIKKETEHAEHEAYLKAMEEKEEQERQRHSNLLKMWQHELAAWRQQDKLSLNMVLKELAELQATVFSGEGDVGEDELRSAMANLKQKAEAKAMLKRSQIEQQNQQKAREDLVQTISENIDKNLSREKAISLTEQLASLKNNISGGHGPDQDLLEEITKQADFAIEQEAMRREMVKAVYRSLQEAGFNVQKPKQVKENGRDEVLIAASRPAGNRVLFQIELDGQCTYKFDNYKGQTCQKDIQQVLPKLTDIYGVDLSDARVLWSNPDDEDAEMKPIPSQTQRMNK